jgi:2-oxoglutarate dehydrogenase E1 component
MTQNHDPFLQDDTQLSALNAIFVEEMYDRWVASPGSVDASWQEFFAGFGDNPQAVHAAVKGASWAENHHAVLGEQEESEKPAATTAVAQQPVLGKEMIEQVSQDSLRAIMMIRAYRVRGHLIADLDPLQQEPNKYHPELDPATYGFGPADMDREIYLDGVLGTKTATPRQILEILRNTYCGSVGVEFMHIQYPEQKSWIQQRVESAKGRPDVTLEEKKFILKNLIEVEAFEDFLHVKYPGSKRFSIQGGDAVIPGLELAIETAARMGVDEIGIGMPHRGRMNVITTVMGKPYYELLSIFHGNLDFPEWVDSSGDVKYHLGLSADREIEGNKVHLSLASNPSHLEAVNPVVCGKIRAKLRQKGDLKTKKTALPILFHGDAAFAGQGVVAETLSFSELRGFRSGGTLNIIVNNQIGFTASPKNSRFTPYPSDVAKAVQAPIFHVNGDDPEAVAFVCKLATEFRQEFNRDVVVDVFCYRKYGHNEGDEPMFTQPLMYKTIKKKEAASTLYANQLIKEGVVTEEEVTKMFDDFKEQFEKDYETAKTFSPNKADWLEGRWMGLKKPDSHKEHPVGDTGVAIEKLREVGMKLTQTPEDFKLNSKIARQMKAKQKMLESGEGVDWALAEALAFGTLLTEGYPVRLTGQDSERGTFSHRHSVLIDQDNENRYLPLNNIQEGQAEYEVVSSSLSEFGILGFEYGYSLAEPNGLTLWEAQFGDFVNGAQIIIDQFISSGEIKWLRMSGLVMLLPHGFEGQGPEHSSARLERFLQMCGEDNWQVINATTPANYFHALRRQLHRDFRKPLIVMTPKSLLRHKLCVSTLEDMGPDSHFIRLIPEVDKLDDKKVKRVVFTSGKVYYDLYEERAKREIDDIAILRVEQYYPFPASEIAQQLKRYPDAEVMWAQEEPENMGAWRFVGPRIGEVLEDLGRKDVRVRYAGRAEAASPATGYLSIHTRQQKQLVEEALTHGVTSERRGKAAA